MLAEHASEWFEGIPAVPADDDDGAHEAAAAAFSPYMSFTTRVRPARAAEVRRRSRARRRALVRKIEAQASPPCPSLAQKVPAVAHVDGSSRLQTVSRLHEPTYHSLIAAFWRLTGVPMVLNTSFNTLRGEPIVESPTDALRSFLLRAAPGEAGAAGEGGAAGAAGEGGEGGEGGGAPNGEAIDLLVLEDWLVTQRPCPLAPLLRRGGASAAAAAGFDDDDAPEWELKPRRCGPAVLETTTTAAADDEIGAGAGAGGAAAAARVRCRMPGARLAAADARGEGGGWFDLADEFEAGVLEAADGETSVRDIARALARDPDDPDDDDPEPLEIAARVARLWERRLLHFGDAPLPIV